MTKQQCQGFFHDGLRCPYAAKHTHHAAGVSLKLCGTHLRVILKRERLGSEQSLLDRWAV